MNRYSLLIAIPMMSLLGCQYVPAKDESSPYYPPPVGSVLTLHQDLEIERDWARVFIQDGRVLPKKEVDQFAPHCNIEVNEVASAGRPQYIRAGEFRIDKVTRRYNLTDSGRLLVASVIVDKDDGRPSFTTLTMAMRLRSTSQPHVRGITCGRMWYGYEPFARQLSIQQIRMALAGIATLTLPE